VDDRNRNDRSERNEHRGVDPDRTEGSAKQIGGSIKEGAGKLVGDEKIKREGQSQQAEGKVQNAWGGAKDTARDTIEGKRR
jgi:uncharacterized protein YjbJ (UPF0337 family)